MGQSTRQNYSFAASGARLSPEGRGPFDVSGERFLVTEDDGFTKLSDARVWLGGVEVTDAVVGHAEFEVSMNAVDVTSISDPERNYIPGTSRAVVTVELVLPGQFNVKGAPEEDWTGPVILDQKELL